MSQTNALEIREKRAVLVGIDNYLDNSIGNLRYSVNDIQSVYEILVDTDRGKFNADSVHLLKNRDENETLLPMKSNIMASIKAMSRGAAPEDSILFFFSGHGIEAKSRAFLLCYESRMNVLTDSALPIDWIKETMVQSDAHACMQ